MSVLVEDAFTTELLFVVDPKAFQPIPKVFSAVVRLIPKPETQLDKAAFRRLVSSSFAQKRKTIFNNLRLVLKDAAAILADSGIDGKRRAETLTLDEWRFLTANVIKSAVNPN